MPKTQFAHIRHWVFDLDNTLYPPHMRLFDQIEAKMTAYICRISDLSEVEASQLRRHYWEKYGTTLAGLMRHYDIEPCAYLEEVHDISFDVLDPEPELADAIKALPGRKIIYTNGSAPYAINVLRARGLDGLFDEIYGIEDANFVPKPEAEAFATVFKADDLRPDQAAMFEDDPRNLRVPFDLGLRTVHVTPDPAPAPHIDHHTSDLADLLTRLV